MKWVSYGFYVVVFIYGCILLFLWKRDNRKKRLINELEATKIHHYYSGTSNDITFRRYNMGEIFTKLEGGRILIKLDKSIYEKEAIMAAAYKMTDTCFIVVKLQEDNQFEVYFEPKNSQSEEELKAIAKNYCNEVLDQQTRLDVEKRYGNIRDLLVKQAFSPIENIKDKINI